MALLAAAKEHSQLDQTSPQVLSFSPLHPSISQSFCPPPDLSPLCDDSQEWSGGEILEHLTFNTEQGSPWHLILRLVWE